MHEGPPFATRLPAAGFAQSLIEKIILIESSSISLLMRTLAAIVDMWHEQSATAALEELSDDNKLIEALQEVKQSFDGDIVHIVTHVLSILDPDD
jgi:hypothetical protein